MALQFVSAFWRKAFRFTLEGSLLAIWIAALCVLSAVTLERHQAQVSLQLSAASEATPEVGAIERLRSASLRFAWWHQQRAAWSSDYSARIAGAHLVLTCSAGSQSEAQSKCNKAARDNLEHGPASSVAVATRVLPQPALPIDQLVIGALALGGLWLVLRVLVSWISLASSGSGRLGQLHDYPSAPIEHLTLAPKSLPRPQVQSAPRLMAERPRLPLMAANDSQPPARRLAPANVWPVMPAPRAHAQTATTKFTGHAQRTFERPRQLSAANFIASAGSPLRGPQLQTQSVVTHQPTRTHNQLALAVIAQPQPAHEREDSQVVVLPRQLAAKPPQAESRPSLSLRAEAPRPAPKHVTVPPPAEDQRPQIVIAQIMAAAIDAQPEPTRLRRGTRIPTRPTAPISATSARIARRVARSRRRPVPTAKPRSVTQVPVTPPSAAIVPRDVSGLSRPISTIGRVTLAPTQPNEVFDCNRPDDWAPSLGPWSEDTLRSLNAVRDQIYRLAEQGCCVVRVCSDPEREDAKSRVAAQLAWLLAQPQIARVLLLEADFSRPAVDRMLGIDVPSDLGFTQQLQHRVNEQVAAPAFTVAQVLPKLHVLAEGRLRLPRMMETKYFSSALAQQRRQYDVIVADGPALGGWLDTRSLDGVVDRVVFVTGTSITQARIERLIKTNFSAGIGVSVIRVDG